MIRATLATACLSPFSLLACAVGLHPAMHPTPRPSTDAGGTSFGALYAKPSSSDASTFSAPYGEGWMRFGGESGQSTIRFAPGMGFFSYRIEVTGPGSSVGVGIEPGIGGGYLHVDGGGELGGDGSGVIAPNAAVLLFFADRRFYVTPRIGYDHYVSGNDSTGIVSLGGALGLVIPSERFLFSVEVSFLHMTSTESGADGSVILLAPSFGMQLTRPSGAAAPPTEG